MVKKIVKNNKKSILVTGNTVIDALLESVKRVKDKPSTLIQFVKEKKEI